MKQITIPSRYCDLLKVAVEENQMLCPCGWKRIHTNRSPTKFDVCRQRFESKQEWASFVHQFSLAVSWLSTARETKTAYNVSGSYSLKHILEDLTGEYISNGAVILAASALDIKSKPVSVNSVFRISKVWIEEQRKAGSLARSRLELSRVTVYR